ncbi:MAG: molybdenum cofactor guanylyltransferase [Pseudomonadales bacterium]
MNAVAAPLLGLILCGGAGTRVGGADKPLLAWQNGTLLDAVVEKIAPQVDALVLSANRNLDQYRRRGVVVTDDWSDYQGPLAGLASVLLHYQTAAGSPAAAPQRYLVCPGDMPLLPDDLGQRLSEGYVTGEPRYVHDGERAQPLCMICDDTALPSLQHYLDNSARSVLGWLECTGARPVPFNNPAAFANFNTLEQLQQSRKPT